MCIHSSICEGTWWKLTVRTGKQLQTATSVLTWVVLSFWVQKGCVMGPGNHGADEHERCLCQLLTFKTTCKCRLATEHTSSRPLMGLNVSPGFGLRQLRQDLEPMRSSWLLLSRFVKWFSSVCTAWLFHESPSLDMFHESVHVSMFLCFCRVCASRAPEPWRRLRVWQIQQRLSILKKLR